MTDEEHLASLKRMHDELNQFLLLLRSIRFDLEKVVENMEAVAEAEDI